ncbi:hypothetical protein COOONC_20838 [Cooperia oncophora]
MGLEHLLVLCCYGGQPFVDFHLTPAHSSTQQIDPTDWQASDIAGSLLDNSSIPLIPHLREVLDVGVSLSVCDLFNVTFTTTADQALFDRYQAKLACRLLRFASSKLQVLLSDVEYFTKRREGKLGKPTIGKRKEEREAPVQVEA